MDAAAADFDNDGDWDILIANEHRPNIMLTNDGKGKFTDESANKISEVGHDSEDIGIANFNNDGKTDIYLAKRGTADILLFGKK